MRAIYQQIKENTHGMSKRDTLEYILTYYWYHLLGIVAVLCFLVFLFVHFAFPEQKPLFTCALVNQRIDSSRDKKVAEDFADYADISCEQVIFDSDYIISYIGNEQKGANESGFDKFFFKWSGGELDAVVMTKSFLQYCIEVGGEFYQADEFEAEGMKLCEVQGVKAIELADTKLKPELDGTENGDFVLVFPNTGTNREICQKFINYMKIS